MADHISYIKTLSPLLQFFFIRALVVSYVAFVLTFFVLHLSFFWCLGGWGWGGGAGGGGCCAS